MYVPDALTDVEDLIMDRCEVSGTGMAALSDAVQHGALPRLDCLNVSGNAIGDDGVAAAVAASGGSAAVRRRSSASRR